VTAAPGAGGTVDGVDPGDDGPGFAPGFFARLDEGDDAAFYAVPRLVTHIDDDAIVAVGDLYDELRIDGDVLDLMSSWVSHFHTPPRHLRVLGMNEPELRSNAAAREHIVHDLNADPRIPLPAESIDDAVCCASVDYLTRPVAVFRDVARVLRPGGRLVCTFSNRVFATKAIRGWLYATDEGRCRTVVEYFDRSGAFGPPTTARRTPPEHRGDPLYAVWAVRREAGNR
jgi:SAM-dependent methyltransferase